MGWKIGRRGDLSPRLEHLSGVSILNLAASSHSHCSSLVLVAMTLHVDLCDRP